MPSFHFGVWVFDSRGRTIARNGEEAKLSRRAFEALHLLLCRYPEAVSKQDLSAELWPDTFVNLTNLNNVVAEIRRAIDDSDHSIVVTKHRFGYAIGIPVLSEAPAGDSTARFALLIGGEMIRLPNGDNIVGRSPDAVVMIADPSVSRRHAVIRVNSERAVVADLRSKNGTFVGDERVAAEHPLAEGNVIRFGGICGIFRDLSGPGTTLTFEGRKAARAGGGTRRQRHVRR